MSLLSIRILRISSFLSVILILTGTIFKLNQINAYIPLVLGIILGLLAWIGVLLRVIHNPERTDRMFWLLFLILVPPWAPFVYIWRRKEYL